VDFFFEEELFFLATSGSGAHRASGDQVQAADDADYADSEGQWGQDTTYEPEVSDYGPDEKGQHRADNQEWYPRFVEDFCHK